MDATTRRRIVEEFNNIIAIDDVLDEMVQELAEKLKPEEVFDEDQLTDWAEKNGYVKAE